MDNEITHTNMPQLETLEKSLTKAKTTNIHYVSRISIKIKENFYTVEYGEDRTVDFDNVDIERERQNLIDDCNYQVDKQAQLILKEFNI